LSSWLARPAFTISNASTPMGTGTQRTDDSIGDFATDTVNGYFRDPTLLSGFEARPGFNKTTPGTSDMAQGVHSHVATDGPFQGIPQGAA
jgi:hypothetical protein